MLAPVCDRLFYAALKARKLNSEIVAEKTVNYHCIWRYVCKQSAKSRRRKPRGVSTTSG